MSMKQSFTQQNMTGSWLLFHKKERNYRYVMLIVLTYNNCNIMQELIEKGTKRYKRTLMYKK